MFTQVTERPWDTRRSFETKDYFLLLSCLHVPSQNALLYGGQQLSRQKKSLTGKTNHSRQAFRSRQKQIRSRQMQIRSRQKQIAHGKNKFTHRKSKSTQNAIFYSRCQSVLEVLLLLTVGHQFHSPCFPLTLASRITANIVYF